MTFSRTLIIISYNHAESYVAGNVVCLCSVARKERVATRARPDAAAAAGWISRRESVQQYSGALFGQMLVEVAKQHASKIARQQKQQQQQHGFIALHISPT
jgi:hypothetical protein